MSYDGEELIGTPFRYGGRGPEAFDCYGLVMEMSKRDLGVTLPDFRSSADRPLMQAIIGGQMQVWKRVETPRRGCVVVLRIGRYISHVGYMLDNRHFLHAWEGTNGVTKERLSEWKQRIIGFYEYNGGSDAL